MSRRRRTRPPIPPLARLVLLLVLVAILLLSRYLESRRSSPPISPSTPTPGTLRIGTWNLRHFSENRRTDLRAVAAIITDASIDLLAIQEVKREGEQVDRLLNVLGPPWRGTISPMTGNYERYAFIYRGDRVQLLDKARLIDDPHKIFSRVPAVAAFRAGEFDFILLSVHLFYSDTDRRRAEAVALAKDAAARVAGSSEKDLIVLGDFNEMGRGNLHYFDAMGWIRLIDKPTNLGSTHIFDNILIDPRHTREYNGRSDVIFFDETRYANQDAQAREQVSDHRPAWAEFSTLGPDDD